MAEPLTGSTRRNPTIAEIARAAHVAKSTASTVLSGGSDSVKISDATRERIVGIAERMGYKPNAAARSLKTGRSQSIVMVVFAVVDYQIMPRLQGVEEFLVPRDYSLQVCTVSDEVGFRGFINLMQANRADGVLLTGIASNEALPLLRELCGEVERVGKPLVAIANAFPAECVKLVAHIDDISGGEQAVTHLIQHGHRRIAMMAIDGQPWAMERLEGYKRAHEKAGIPVDPNLVVLGGLDLRFYRDAALRLLQSHDFTAIFTVTDAMAVAAQSALRDVGRSIPQDCAIIGFNDEPGVADYNFPPLTTVHNPFREVGRTAAEMLVDLIEGRPPKSSRLPVSLVIRESCGCAGAGEVKPSELPVR